MSLKNGESPVRKAPGLLSFKNELLNWNTRVRISLNNPFLYITEWIQNGINYPKVTDTIPNSLQQIVEILIFILSHSSACATFAYVSL